MPQANPFDQFDQLQSQNPFDQFDGIADAPQSLADAPQQQGPAMSAYEPSLFERAANWLNPPNPAAASNELVAQEIAQEQGVPVDDVYASVGGSRPTIDPQGRAGLSSVAQGFGSAGHQAQAASAKATGNYDKGALERMGEALPAGWDNMVGSLELGRFALAGGDVGLMAQKLSDKIGQNAQRAQQRTPGEAGVYGALGAVSDSSGLLEGIGSGVRAAGEFFGNPGDAAVISAEQAANSVPSLGMGAVGAGAGAVVGGVPGAIIGGRSGMATGTVATEFGAEIEEAIVDHLGAEGVNAPDRAQRIAAILQDPAFMSEAKVRAAKKGLTVAAMDQVFMTLGGKVASKAGAGSKVGAVGLDMAGESVGEATSQLVARGEVDAGDALLEGLAGGPTSIIETGAGYASETYKSSPAYRRQQILKQLEQSVDATDIGGGADAAAVNSLRPDVGPEFVDPLNAAGPRNDDGSPIQGGLKTVQPFQTAEMPVDGSPVPFVPVPRTQTDEQERPLQPNGSEVEFESVAPQQQPKGAGLSLVDPNSNAIEYAPPAVPSRIDELAAGVDRGIKAHVDKQRASRLPSNLPDQRLNNPAYRSELERSLKGLDAQHKNMDSKVVEPKTDDLFSAIAKLGGINKAELEADGFDKADLGKHRLGIRPVFSKKGKSVDDMAEALVERGYLPERDVDALKEMIRLQLAGDEQFSPAGIEHTMDQAQQIVRAKALGVPPLTAQKAITKALKGETLGKAEIEIVKGALGLVGEFRGTQAAEVAADRQSTNEQRKVVREGIANIERADDVRQHLGSVPFDAEAYAAQAEAAFEADDLPSYSGRMEAQAIVHAKKAGVADEIINELELRYSDTNQYIAALYRAAGQVENAGQGREGKDSEDGGKASVAGEAGRGHGRSEADSGKPGDGRRDSAGRAERKHDTEPLFGSETDELLTDYTEEDLQKQAKEKAAREKAEADKQAKAEAKDKADSDASSFQLTGSDRKADANPAQVDLLDVVEQEESKSIDEAAHEAATSPKNDLPEPTEAQKEAGNYKVGRLKVHGLDISIENPKGSKRSGTAPDGKKWENTMGAHYGYIRKTEGADGDHVDVFVGDSPESESVWIIDQVNKDGSFDEHKVLLGFKNKITARKAYVSSYDKGWTVGPITPMNIEQFKEWLQGDTTKPLSDQLRSPDKPKAKPIKTPSDEGVSVSGTKEKSAPSNVDAETKSSERVKRLVSRLTELAEGKSEPFTDDGGKKYTKVTKSMIGKLYGQELSILREHGGLAKDFTTINTETENAGIRLTGKNVGEGLDYFAWHTKYIPVADASNADKSSSRPKKLADSGDELAANKRLGRRLTADDLKNMNAAEQVVTAVKSKVWPKPDYQQMVDDGTNPLAVYAMKIIYDAMAAKPARTSEAEIQRFVDVTSGIRDVVEEAVPSKAFSEKIMDALDIVQKSDRSDYLGQMRAGQAVAASMKTLTDEIFDKVFPKNQSGDRWGSKNREGNDRVLSVGGNRFIQRSAISSRELTKALKDIAEGWPGKREAWQRSYKVEKSGDEWLLKSKSGRVLSRHGAEQEAIDAARDKAKVEREKSFKEPSVSIDHVERTGPARRSGDVTADDLRSEFGFRGVNFGNWMNAADRQAHVNQAFDAFHDLADLLEVPPKAMSLGGMLGIAFGAQGNGKAAAHFVPGMNEINITKTTGAGSLAHEWGHALDHNYGVLAGLDRQKEPFLSEFADKDRYLNESKVRTEVVEAYKKILGAMEKVDVIRSKEDMEAIRQEAEEKSRKRVDQVLFSFAHYANKGTEKQKEQIARLSERMKKGERGDFVRLGKTDSNVGANINEFRDILSDINGGALEASRFEYLDSVVSSLGYALDADRFFDVHKPQVTKNTRYRQNAMALDVKKKDPYWSTRLEMFARAFEMYVLERLADKDAKNDYLTAPWKNLSQEAEEIGIEAFKRYPQGEERQAINDAFDILVAAIEHKETEEGSVVLFSKSATLAEDKKPKGMEVQRVQQITETFLAKFKGAGTDEIDVRIHRDHEDAFGREIARELERKKHTIKGGFDPKNNRLILVAANLASYQDTIDTLQHEILVHKGLGLFAPDVRERIISAVLEAAPQSPTLKPIWARVLVDYKDDSDTIKAEEVIAAIAERRLSKLDRFINKMLITFRKVLAAIGWTKPGLGNRDLLEMIYKIGDAFMEGKQAGRRNDLIERMDSRSTSTQSAYEQRIDELFAGESPNHKGVRILDRSDILALMGMSDQPVHLVEGKVEKGIYNHGLTAADWKKVPAWLENPAAVFESDTSPGRLVFIGPEEVNGVPVRMIVDPRPDGKGVNLLINAYDADRNPFARWAEDGLLKYLDSKKTTPASGAFLPRLAGLSEKQARGRKIYTGADLFKYRQTNGGAMFRKDTGGLPDPKSREGRLSAFFDGIAHQPIDRMFRLPFDALNLLDSHGRMKGSVSISEKAEQIIKEWKPFNGRFEWMNNILETARHGLIDRYKLSDEYVQTYREAEAFGRKIDMKALDMLKALEDRGVSGPEAAVLQQMLTGEQIQDKDIQHLGAPILEAIDQLGLAAVQYGIITREQFERNRGSYLHRSYMRHEGDFSTVGKWLMRKQLSKAKKIHGKTSKGRGIQVKADMDRLLAHVPADWYGIKRIGGKPDLQALNGRKFVMLENPGVILSHTETLEGFDRAAEQRSKGMIYWPADLDIPGKFEAYRNRGTFEVRGAIGNKVTLWRDYTKAERENMGEILDARYNIAKTFTLLSHDIAMGKFYQDISRNDEWFQKELPPGVEALTAGEASSMRNLSLTDWVEVPDTTIEKSAGTKRWGALAGGYVRSEIWRDLNELDKMSQMKTWRKVMTQWKINHTARSPVTHTNNVMSNLMWMDLADVRMTDLVAGIISYKRKDQHWRDAQEHGAFGGAFANEELRRKIMEPILDDLLKQNMDAAPDVENSAVQLWKMGATIFRWAKKADQAMLTAYQVEDEIFRMATYVRRVSLGDSPKEAARIAREQFIDYDIRAPWVNAARSTVLPFAGYPYRAIPNLAKAVIHRPWKLAKYITLGRMAIALGYMMAPGDDEEEYRTMREDQQGSTVLGTPRMMRLPYRDEFGNPMFIDVRRWIPAGDVFDLHQANSAIPVPAWLQVGGPIVLGLELAFNYKMFYQEEITNRDTDSLGEQFSKTADYLYKSWMPSAVYIPGSYYWDKAGTAWNGGRDILGRPYSFPQALLSSVGIKVQPHDVELGYAFRSRDLAAQARLITGEIRQVMSDYSRNMIDAEGRDEELARAKLKLERLAEKQRELQGR